MQQGNGKTRGVWLWPLVSILMLVGMIGEARTRVTPADAAPHQARCKAAINGIPLTLVTPTGIWSGSDVEVPKAATQLLRPNEILSRRYEKDGEGTIADLLIVDCNDARDLEGHYPPRCYPASGQKLLTATPHDLRLGEMLIHGTEYTFAVEDGEIGEETTVFNFFVLPYVPGTMVSHQELNGAIRPDIDSVYTSGQDHQRTYYGAAEFQLILPQQMGPAQRDEIYTDLLTPMQDAIRTLMNRDAGGK
jgi:hypothetical protein